MTTELLELSIGPSAELDLPLLGTLQWDAPRLQTSGRAASRAAARARAPPLVMLAPCDRHAQWAELSVRKPGVLRREPRLDDPQRSLGPGELIPVRGRSRRDGSNRTYTYSNAVVSSSTLAL